MVGAVVHEWISTIGGSEKVLARMADTFPSADIYTLWNDATGFLPNHNITESWISRTPLRRSKPLALPFMPAAWRRLHSLKEYDWMLVSSHLFAHHARFRGPNSDIPKFVYAHTPARYIWTPWLDQRGASPGARAASALLKPLDKIRAHEAVSVAANSYYIRDRIRRTWEVDATVIYPPVSVVKISKLVSQDPNLTGAEDIEQSQLHSQFILGASRFVPYKRLDLVIALGELLDLPVVIAGSGPDEERLRALADAARVPVRVITSPSDRLLYTLYARAAAYVFPPVEDFGLMPVEAMAAGGPVVVNRNGGARESAAMSAASAVVDFDDLQETVTAIEELISSQRRPSLSEIAHLDESCFDARLSEWVGAKSDSR
jgi:glycosyltransferase involved in cell wall biosynthesis